MRSEAFPWQHSRIIRIVQRYNRWEFHLIALLASEVVFVKMPSRQQKRGELNDERNTFKIETVDELVRVPPLMYNADP